MSTTSELNIRPTLAEWIDAGGLPSESRNARIEMAPIGLPMIVMDDIGYGECEKIITDSEAAELVRAGLIRDAR